MAAPYRASTVPITLPRSPSWNNQRVSNAYANAAAPPLQRYHPGARSLDVPGCADLAEALRALLAGQADVPVGKSVVAQAAAHGLREFIAWHAQSGGAIRLEHDVSRESLMADLRRASTAKLAGDGELQRLFDAARGQGIGLLLIKGEALARQLYPDPACRPTADFDLWVEPARLREMRGLLGRLNYTSWRGFHGAHIFAQQFFVREPESSGVRFQLDLHWDLCNRRYFRRRLPWFAVAGEAEVVPLNPGSVSAPALPHALLVACVHLAAADPDEPLSLKWLLDIRLLLDRLSENEVAQVCKEAADWGLLGPLAVYAPMAEAVLGDSVHAEMLAGLPRPGPAERADYLRSCERRVYDLVEYGRRLPWVERFRLLGEVLRYGVRR